MKYPAEVYKSERREFVRVPVETLISFRVPGESEENQWETFLGTAKNISASGVFLATDVKLSDKSDLLMSFDLANEETGQVFLKVRDLKGRIVRGFEPEHKIADEAYAYGIKFREVSDSLKNKMNHFIVRRQIELNLKKEK
ncbi:MAG: PilZ domain-containing protein [Candidatus Hydrothermarchaeaceae archaeon]